MPYHHDSPRKTTSKTVPSRMLRFLLTSTFATLICTLVGCQREPAIDLSSSERYLQSLQRIKASLSPEQSMRLDAAIEAITQYEIQNALQNCLPVRQCTKDVINTRLHQALHGRTANDILNVEQQYVLNQLHA